MINLETIKSGDRVAYNFGVPLRLADGTSISNGDVLTVAKPAICNIPDKYMRSVQLLNVEMPGSPQNRIPLNPMFLDLAGDSAGEHGGCKCDTFSVLMVRGCQCGYLSRERAAREAFNG